MTSQKKFYLNPNTNKRESYFYKNHSFYLEITRLDLDSQLMQMFNSDFSSLNKCSDGDGDATFHACGQIILLFLLHFFTIVRIFTIMMSLFQK